MVKLKYYAVFIADKEDDYEGIDCKSFSNDAKDNGYTVYFSDFGLVTGGWDYYESIYNALDLLAVVYYNNLEDDFGKEYDVNLKLKTPMSKDGVLKKYFKDTESSKLNENDFVELIEVDTDLEFFKVENMNKRANKIREYNNGNPNGLKELLKEYLGY